MVPAAHNYPKVEETEDGRFCPVLKIKHAGRIDLGTYSTARHAAVAFDVARLIYVHQMRPDVDLRVDVGLMIPADAYLVDPAFTQLLESGQSFEDVVSLLRSGVLVDTFLCAKEHRATRSNTSGDRPAGSGRRGGGGAPQHGGLRAEPAAGRQQAAQPAAKAAQQQAPAEAPPAAQQAKSQQRTGPKSSDDTQHALPLSPFEAAAGAEARAAPEPAGRGGGDGGAQPRAVSPLGSPASATLALATACGGSAGLGSPAAASPGKRRPMRWVEYPMRGGGQFVSCISERAMKANMTLPAKMKAEIFQVSEAQAQIKAYDLAQGSHERWEWEVRDYVGKPGDARNATYITNLGPFFRHYNAAPGDVMVVVASAPGAVKATVWKCQAPEALEFKAHLAKKAEKPEKGEKLGRQAGGSGGKKRAADGAAERQGTAKAAKPAAGPKSVAAAAARAAPAAARPPQPGAAKADASLSPDPSRQLSKTGSGAMRAPPPPGAPPGRPAAAQPPCQQQQQQQQQQPDAPPARAQAAALPRPSPPRVRVGAPPNGPQAMAESGLDPSHLGSGDDTMALSPTGQVAQSPFRHALLQAAPPAAVAIKQEQREQQPQEAASQREQEQEQRAPAAGAQLAADGGIAAGGGSLSPARMSCADASALLGGAAAAGGSTLPAGQQQALSQPAASGAGGMALSSESHLPDPLLLANDEGGVYVAMAALLRHIAGTGHVPVECVNSYRRSFGRLEPHGKRWFNYDSLKQLVDAGEWADVQEWLLCK